MTKLKDLTPLTAPPALSDGWGFSQLGNNPMGEGPGALKHQIIGTLHAATYMRSKSVKKGEKKEKLRRSPSSPAPPPAVPLIGFNVVVILLKVIIG